MNYFVELFGYDDRPTLDELKNWKKRGNDVDFKDAKTELFPANVAPAEAIQRVLLCNPPGMNGWHAPLSELFLSWRITCPDESFESVVDKAGLVCAALQVEMNKKKAPKEQNG